MDVREANTRSASGDEIARSLVVTRREGAYSMVASTVLQLTSGRLAGFAALSLGAAASRAGSVACLARFHEEQVLGFFSVRPELELGHRRRLRRRRRR